MKVATHVVLGVIGTLFGCSNGESDARSGARLDAGAEVGIDARASGGDDGSVGLRAEAGAPVACGVADLEPIAAPGTTHVLAVANGVDGGASSDVAGTVAAPGSFVVAEGPRDQCVQLDSARAPNGAVLVAPHDSGPFCLRCAQRNSAGAGLAFFSLPSDATSLGAGAMITRIALRDCDTLTDIPGPFAAGSTLRDLPMRDHDAATQAILRTTVIAIAGTWLEGVVLRADPGEWSALEADVTTRLDAGITVRFASRNRADGGDLVYRERDYSVVDGVLNSMWSAHPEAKPSAADPRVPIVATTCLHVTNAVTGEPTSPQGQTTHIPGIAGISALADASLVAPSSCGIFEADDAGVSAAIEREVFVATVAHEIGHYLGLYHTVEVGGPDDLLADTDANNLMNPNPLLSTSRGLSPSQRVIVRRHPAVRWPLPGQASCAVP